jgi:hypothetical protein
MATAIFLHAAYVASPWFEPPALNHVGDALAFASLSRSTWGRSLLVVLEVSFAALLWVVGGRSGHWNGRWYS